MSGLLAFPRTINEKAARVVAGVVALAGVVILATGAFWLLVPVALGFWARVLTGPRLSPLALLASRVITPRLGPAKEVSGPPKRFAQGMGAVMTTAAALFALVLGREGAATGLVVALVIAATLESALALCLGCRVFGLLVRAGLIPEEVCAQCTDIGTRPRTSVA